MYVILCMFPCFCTQLFPRSLNSPWKSWWTTLMVSSYFWLSLDDVITTLFLFALLCRYWWSGRSSVLHSGACPSKVCVWYTIIDWNRTGLGRVMLTPPPPSVQAHCQYISLVPRLSLSTLFYTLDYLIYIKCTFKRRRERAWAALITCGHWWCVQCPPCVLFMPHWTRHQCPHVIKAAQPLPLRCLNVHFMYIK